MFVVSEIVSVWVCPVAAARAAAAPEGPCAGWRARG